jgi:hypothetical protein
MSPCQKLKDMTVLRIIFEDFTVLADGVLPVSFLACQITQGPLRREELPVTGDVLLLQMCAVTLSPEYQ